VTIIIDEMKDDDDNSTIGVLLVSRREETSHPQSVVERQSQSYL